MKQTSSVLGTGMKLDEQVRQPNLPVQGYFNQDNF